MMMGANVWDDPNWKKGIITTMGGATVHIATQIKDGGVVVYVEEPTDAPDPCE
jgi:hypothetical protein